MKTEHIPQYFHFFNRQICVNELPNLFTFPFYYEPHPLAIEASEIVQEYLETTTDFEHNFGLKSNDKSLAIGKMFGVLVVENENGKIGFLAGCSGKLAGTNYHRYFVPPVFDMLSENSFFVEEEKILNNLNHELEQLENDVNYLQLIHEQKQTLENLEIEISLLKGKNKESKDRRKSIRKIAQAEGYYTEALEADLIKESLYDKHQLRVVENNFKKKINTISDQLVQYITQIDALKNERKKRSNLLQRKLFEQYSFLNQYGESASLGSIFEKTVFQTPPAGAGECATPKLLQYAFQHKLKPLAMAEFWWGMSPKSEIRKHRQYYPACSGKCEPILAHMLQDIPTEPNPLQEVQQDVQPIEILYEDQYLVVIHKPENLLSVPGIHLHDSVYHRMKTQYPKHTGPLIVHRLDMQTSGLMVIALQKDIHKKLQKQFIERKVKKRYVALLSGSLDKQSGIIDLPLCLDIMDRPRQKVCKIEGKKAITNFSVRTIYDGTTLIDFCPITGRTHQLRVHSAHQEGLNSPIMGDDLYGTKADRLYLHAAELTLTHPVTRETMTFNRKADFE